MQELGIAVIRQFLIGAASLRPARGKGKVFVVREADLLSDEAQNSLLKLLAMASEAGVKFTLADIEKICARTPNICRIAPSATPEGRIYHVQDAHRQVAPGHEQQQGQQAGQQARPGPARL